MATFKKFEEIEAGRKARELIKRIYKISRTTSFARDYGLKDQIRRASVSIMSNIAEGFESRTDIQFINFLGMARASAGEVRAQLYIASDQKYITEEQLKEDYALAEKCTGQIAKFSSYLEANPRQRRVSDDGMHYEI